MMPPPDSSIATGRPPWTVLLVGGSSGTGKTTLAEAIGREVGAPWAQADDYRLILQRLTSATQLPDLHAFLSQDVWRRSPEALRDQLIAVGQVISHALEIVVANHVATNLPLILEGDGILPALAARQAFAELDVGDQVRAVFLVEPDEEVLLNSMRARGRGLDLFNEHELRVQARVSWLYGQWLAAESARLDLTVVQTRPWSTLADRIIAVIGGPSTPPRGVLRGEPF